MSKPSIPGTEGKNTCWFQNNSWKRIKSPKKASFHNPGNAPSEPPSTSLSSIPPGKQLLNKKQEWIVAGRGIGERQEGGEKRHLKQR